VIKHGWTFFRDRAQGHAGPAGAAALANHCYSFMMAERVFRASTIQETPNLSGMSDQPSFAQPGILALWLLQALGLIEFKPTILLAPPIVRH
jgi:hypothetical protein